MSTVLTPQALAEAVAAAPVRRRRRRVPAWIPLLALLDLCVAGSSLWCCRVAAALVLFLLPGQLLLQALHVRADAIRRFPVYLVAASVVMLLAVGLCVDLAGPALGAAVPLRPLPLTAGLDAALVALGAAGRRAPWSCRLDGSDVLARARWLWPVLLPLAAVAATARLDNGRSGAVALGVLVAVAVLVPACTVLAPRLHRQHLSMVLYGAGLAVMLLTSMRSAYVVGYDISTEYHDLHQTVLAGIWHGGHLSAYSAMLSLTVLPASLHAWLGGQDVWVFKLVYPALFATFPVAVFWLASRLLSRRGSFVAAALVLVQYYFFQQQPEIARQEIGLLLFAALVAAILDGSLGRRAQLPLVGLLAAALVVSHYSTAYVTIGMCLVVALLAAVVGIFSRRRRVPVLPWLAAAAVAGLVGFVWYVPVTHSTRNIGSVTATFRKHGIAFLPGRKSGQSVISAYLNGLRRPPPTPAEYQRDVAALYASDERFIIPLPAASDPRYDLRAAPVPTVAGSDPGLAGDESTLQLVIQQAINALGVLGSLVLALRRRSSPVARAIGYAGLAATAVLAASRLSGTFAADYNSSRLFLQCLLAVAVAQVALVETVLKRWPTLRALALGGCGVVLAIAFTGNSGLDTPVVGGNPPLVLYRSGEDYSRLYITPPEQAAAEWLAAADPRRHVVYADNYGVLRLDEFTGLSRGVFTAITPRTLDQHAWVLATGTNVVGGRTWGQTVNGVLDYAFPTSYLGADYDVVFSAGTAEVYHR